MHRYFPLAAVPFAFAVATASAQTPDAAVNTAAHFEPPSATDGSLKPPVQMGTTAKNAREIEMIRQLARQRGGQPAALAQVIQLTRNFDDALAAEIIDDLAAAHVAAGDLNLAAETRRALAEQFPAQPIAHESVLWLVRLYASSEVAHARRTESPGAADIRRQLSLHKAATGGRGLQSSTADPAKGESSVVSGEPKPDPFATYALHFAAQALTTHTALADNPAFAFQRSVAARRAGQAKTTQALLSLLKHRRAEDPWAQAARAETWLLDKSREGMPKPVVHCTAAETPPHLDGVLEEPYWQGKLEPAATDVHWAYDHEFLYIAVRCSKLADVAYPRDNRPRPRDGDLQRHDRVRLSIDVDRDYATWFELVVDSRGWTADRCWGDPAWNPEWFVAAAESPAGDAWIIEAAIPLVELSQDPPTAGAAWACAAERIPPTSNTPPHTPGPEAFSILLFD